MEISGAGRIRWRADRVLVRLDNPFLLAAGRQCAVGGRHAKRVLRKRGGNCKTHMVAVKVMKAKHESRPTLLERRTAAEPASFLKDMQGNSELSGESFKKNGASNKCGTPAAEFKDVQTSCGSSVASSASSADLKDVQTDMGIFRAPASFDFVQKVGQGASGAVAVFRTRTGKLAIKKVALATAESEDIKRVQREVYLHRQCQHANVITLLDAYEENGHMYMITPLMDASLKQVLRVLTETHHPVLLRQLLCGPV